MKDKKSILFTAVFHGIIVLIIAFFGFTTPLPLPEEEGILINFGTDESGFGENEPRLASVPDQTASKSQVEEATPVEETREISTQDFEEAPSLKKETITEKKNDQEREPTITKQSDLDNQTEEEIEEERKVIEKALYKGSKNTGQTTEGEGITEGDGNQGDPSGAPGSDNYAGGPSSGSGGVEFSLSGRNPVNLPKPKYEYQVEGKVVVQIKVDRNGKVTYARAGYKGSNTNDQRLLNAATEAALKASFDQKPDAPYEQIGTITYHFILQ